jgi:hypothetical protein
VFDPAELFGKARDAGLDGTQDAVLKIVEHEGTAVVDIEAELAAPLGESTFGDAEFGGDADEAPALGAELDKFLNRFLIFHNKPFVTGANASCWDRSDVFSRTTGSENGFSD